MGFLKRIMSLGRGSKKRKAKQSGPIPPVPEVSDEAAMSQLLRASSLHFHVVAETPYHSLPPLAHPVNELPQTPPIARRNTYTVKVHRRITHSRTEFPNANRSRRDSDVNSSQTSLPQVMSPSDANRLRKLRQDPSVVSLLNIYDCNGAPNPTAFSNTPPPNIFNTPAARSYRKPPRSITRSLRSLIGSVKKEYGLELSPGSSSQTPGGTPSGTLPSTHTLSRATSVYEADFATPSKVEVIGDSSGETSNVTGTSMQAEAGSLSQGEISTVLSPIKSPRQRASQVFRFLTDPKELSPLPPLPPELKANVATVPSESPVEETLHDGSLVHSGGDLSQPRQKIGPSFPPRGPRAPATPIMHRPDFDIDPDSTTLAVESFTGNEEGDAVVQYHGHPEERVPLMYGPRGPRARASPFPMKSLPTKVAEVHHRRHPMNPLTNATVEMGIIGSYRDDPMEPSEGLQQEDTFTAVPPRPSRNPSRSAHAVPSSSTHPSFANLSSSPTMLSKHAQRLHRERSAQINRRRVSDENAMLPVVARHSSQGANRKLLKRTDQAPFISDVFSSNLSPVPVTPPASRRMQYLSVNGAGFDHQNPSPASSSELSPEAKELMDNLRMKKRSILEGKGLGQRLLR